MKRRFFENERRSTLKLTNDFVFHYIYGRDSDSCRTALTGLLNLILARDFDPIKSVVIKNPLNYRELEYDKETLMDIKAETDSGIILDIEVQTGNYAHYPKRSIYYASQMTNRSLNKGETYDKMRMSLVITIVEDKLFKAGEEMPLHSRFCYMERETHRVLDDITQIHLLELGRIDAEKPVSEMSLEEKLCMYLKYGCEEEYAGKTEAILKELEGLEMTEELFWEMTQDEEAYEKARRKAIWLSDRNSEMKDAREEGLAEGLEMGLAKGRTEGLTEGLAKGRSEGLTEGFTKGESRMSALTLKLMEDNRMDELKKALVDTEYREKLYEEFGL